MQAWDSWRKYIAEGRGGSWPRDAFEALLDCLDEERAEAADLIESKAAEIAAHREKTAAWMLANSLPTGHGDTVDDLLAEASAGIVALRDLLDRFRAAHAFAGADAWDGGQDMIARFAAASAASNAALGTMTNDEIAAFGKKFHAESSTVERTLRAGDWVGPLLEWEGRSLFLRDLKVGWVALEDWKDIWKWEVGIDRSRRGVGIITEAAARSAVETAVKEALGVKPAAEQVDKDAHMDCYQYGAVSVIAEPVRTCATCAYKDVEAHADPCFDCWTWSYWTPKTTASEESGS